VSASSAQTPPGLVTGATMSRSATTLEKKRARQWKAVAVAGAIGVLIAVPFGVWMLRSPPQEPRVSGSINGVPATQSASAEPSSPAAPSAAPSATPSAANDPNAPVVVSSTDSPSPSTGNTLSPPKPAPTYKPPKPKPTSTTTHAPIF
jgi:hypothetical protein